MAGREEAAESAVKGSNEHGSEARGGGAGPQAEYINELFSRIGKAAGNDAAVSGNLVGSLTIEGSADGKAKPGNGSSGDLEPGKLNGDGKAKEDKGGGLEPEPGKAGVTRASGSDGQIDNRTNSGRTPAEQADNRTVSGRDSAEQTDKRTNSGKDAAEQNRDKSEAKEPDGKGKRDAIMREFLRQIDEHNPVIERPAMPWESRDAFNEDGSIKEDDKSLDRYAQAVVDALHSKNVDGSLHSLTHNGHNFSPERYRALIERINQSLIQRDSDMRLELTQTVHTTNWRPGTPGVAIHSHRLDLLRGGNHERSYESMPAFEGLGRRK